MSIIKHVTLQKIVAHDFRYDPHTYRRSEGPQDQRTQVFFTSTVLNLLEPFDPKDPQNAGNYLSRTRASHPTEQGSSATSVRTSNTGNQSPFGRQNIQLKVMKSNASVINSYCSIWKNKRI